MKPYLKWAGGKRQLLPEIRNNAPKRYGCYYEPFVGAGAVLFHLQPGRAVVNDFNSQLVTTYRAVRDHAEELIALLKEHRRRDSRDYFYEVRAMDRDAAAFSRLSETERAARLIYLNKTCFNGLYRVNAQGLFNVPRGSYKRPVICEEPVLRAVSRYLNENDVTLLNGDFAAAVAGVGAGDFVYFDPPYHSPDNTNFTGYQAGGFNESEQERLRDTFDELTARGAKCLLSNADTDFIRKIYAGRRYRIRSVLANRNINSNAGGRGRVREVLIRNW